MSAGAAVVQVVGVIGLAAVERRPVAVGVVALADGDAARQGSAVRPRVPRVEGAPQPDTAFKSSHGLQCVGPQP